MTITERIAAVEAKLQGRAQLVAVSKYHPAEAIREAYEGGQRIFGESHAMEVLAKYEALPKDIQWHFIGHLQTNKVKYIAPFVSLIHSVDSAKLMAEIDKQAHKAGRTIDVLIEVNISAEENKYGFTADEAREMILSHAKQYEAVNIVGLMGMATDTDDEALLRQQFSSLRMLYDDLNASGASLRTLSMGMSGDYDIAVECGSTMVRVGSYIFGQRDYSK